MSKRGPTLFLAILLTLIPHVTWADDLTPAKEAGIRTLIGLTGTDRIGLALGAELTRRLLEALHTTGEEIPGEIYVIVNEEVKGVLEERMPELLNDLIPVYHRHFEHGEILDLIAFYRSPAGQKALQVMPQLQQASREIGLGWGERLGLDVMTRIDRRLDREGFGPAGH